MSERASEREREREREREIERRERERRLTDRVTRISFVSRWSSWSWYSLQ